jgi:hypothetical protein
MTSREYEVFESHKMQLSKFWVPIQWALKLIVQAREEDKIATDQIMWNTQEVCSLFMCLYNN